MTVIRDQFRAGKTYRIFKITLLSFILCSTVIAGVFSAFIFHSMSELKAIKALEQYEPPIATKIYDIKNRLITKFALEKRELITFNDIPVHLINAITATEDERFYTHFGFNPWRMTTAFLLWATGQRGHGGSTITVQLAKLLFEKSAKREVSRKIRELWYAIQIEKMYTKQEILQFYFNQVNFGHGCYGLGAAANFFFKKDASELNLAECSLLAGIPKSPTYYSPIRYIDMAQKRHKAVLISMVRKGFISSEKAAKTYNNFWNHYAYQVRSRQSTIADLIDNKAPYFIEHIRERLEKAFGKRNLYKNGYQIYTTLNLDHQRQAQKHLWQQLEKHQERNNRVLPYIHRGINRFAPHHISMLSDLFCLPGIANHKAKIINRLKKNIDNDIINQLKAFATILGQNNLNNQLLDYSYNPKFNIDEKPEGALVSIDPSTGYISAMVGGSGFSYENQFNHVTKAKRQIGSQMKPFVYAAGIDKRKITAATLIDDSPVVIGETTNDEPYIPQNYSGEYHGLVRAREALRRSINVCAVKVLDMVSPATVREYGKTIFRCFSKEDLYEKFPDNYTMGLGSGVFSPLDLCTAFSVFANEGKEVMPLSVRYVTDRYGSIIKNFEKHSPPRQLINPGTAFIVTKMLSDVFAPGGTAFKPELLQDFPHQYYSAGKTGTTGNWTDAWFSGYNKHLCTTIWIGFDSNKSLGRGMAGGYLAAPIWIKYNKNILQYKKTIPFQRPNQVVARTICKESGKKEGIYCTRTMTEYFLKGTEPKATCHIHEKEYKEARHIIDVIKGEKAKAFKLFQQLKKKTK
ncbi:MAG TPA: PBP1A family penicillin-binding protein [Spirochaetota bacterium]|nr:PBP1A family penicillin-binding protein [Spirochaetota bacterium]